ncbi:MAG: protein kinase [bacterium]
MAKFSEEKITQALRYCRDPQARRRGQLFLRALRLGNVAQACREYGVSPQWYRYWWRRFREAGFRREGLQTRSRRPKRSPRKIPPKVEAWIADYRRRFGHSGAKIRLLLEREKKVRLSLPTVYRALRRLGVIRKGERSFREEGAPRRPRRKRAAPRGAEQKPPAKIDGRYRVLDFLGSGGGGKVYLVEDERSGQQRALKLLEGGREADPGLVALLENEFSSLASLRHPNLAEVFDLGTLREGIYFTSEYVPGSDFLTAARRADLNTVFRLIVQVLAALDFLHRRGILHLDLKPSNILVSDPDRSGALRVKLIDFGGSEWRRRGQAEAGETMGTPPFVAPELLMDRPAGPAADLYALGMVLHQVFYGRFPFRATDPLAMMQEQVYEEPLRLRELPPALPESFAELLAKLVARDPADRYASAQEVLAALNRFLGEDFSLRPARVPAEILRESDFLFHEGLVRDLTQRLQEGGPKLLLLSGGAGFGKTHLVTRVKEQLQLRRVFPRVLSTWEDCQAYLRSPRSKTMPLLIDWQGTEPEALGGLLQQLDECGVAALVTTRRRPVPEWIAQAWLEIPPLDAERLRRFFAAEIAGFPVAETGHPLLQVGQGSPRHLQEVLEALQEEGALDWTELGWTWREAAKLDYSSLLSKQQVRWRERREHCLKILTMAPLGLEAQVLAGLLGTEAGVLEVRLEAWEREGALHRRRRGGHTLYYRKSPGRSQPQAEGRLDWPSWVEEWKQRYAAGQFEAVARWAESFRNQAKREDIPSVAALWLARHCAAAGQGERALSFLEANAAPPGDEGLYFEVLGRARFLVGALDAAERALQEAANYFATRQDEAGLSRVANLRGSLAKKRADFSGAAQRFEEAIAKAHAAGDYYLAGLAEMNLGLLRQERGEFREAREAYEAASRSAERAEHPLLSGRLLQNRLNLAFAMGRSREAEGLCHELSRLAWEHRFPDLQAAALQYLSLLAGQQGHQGLRLSYLNRALHLLRSRDPSPAYVQALFNRAYFFWEQGNYTPAELEAGQALHLAQALALPLLSAWSQLLLGKILRDRPRPDFNAAGRLLNRAHHALHRLQNRQLLWEVAFERGLLAKKRGESAEARRFFEAARRDLEALLAALPEAERKSYLRDRKLEMIERQLQELDS